MISTNWVPYLDLWEKYLNVIQKYQNGGLLKLYALNNDDSACRKHIFIIF